MGTMMDLLNQELDDQMAAYQAAYDAAYEKRHSPKKCCGGKCRHSPGYMEEWLANNRERLNVKAWKKYWENPEKARAGHRERARNDRAGRVASNRKWRANNREASNAWAAAWRVLNRDRLNKEARDNYDPDAARVKAHKRRDARGEFTKEQIRARVDFFGGVCAYCGGPYEHIDHVIAIANGGTNWPANLRPACQPCNNRKGAKTWLKCRL